MIKNNGTADTGLNIYLLVNHVYPIIMIPYLVLVKITKLIN